MVGFQSFKLLWSLKYFSAKYVKYSGVFLVVLRKAISIISNTVDVLLGNIWKFGMRIILCLTGVIFPFSVLS